LVSIVKNILSLFIGWV